MPGTVSFLDQAERHQASNDGAYPGPGFAKEGGYQTLARPAGSRGVGMEAQHRDDSYLIDADVGVLEKKVMYNRHAHRHVLLLF